MVDESPTMSFVEYTRILNQITSWWSLLLLKDGIQFVKPPWRLSCGRFKNDGMLSLCIVTFWQTTQISCNIYLARTLYGILKTSDCFVNIYSVFSCTGKIPCIFQSCRILHFVKWYMHLVLGNAQLHIDIQNDNDKSFSLLHCHIWTWRKKCNAEYQTAWLWWLGETKVSEMKDKLNTGKERMEY